MHPLPEGIITIHALHCGIAQVQTRCRFAMSLCATQKGNATMRSSIVPVRNISTRRYFEETWGSRYYYDSQMILFLLAPIYLVPYLF